MASVAALAPATAGPATGASWTPAETLCRDCGSDAVADVAVAPGGLSVALWVARDRVDAAVRRPGERFGTPERLGDGPGSRGPVRATVAVGADGTAVAAWEEGLLSVLAAVRPPGGPWGPSERIAGGVLPDAAVGPDGTAYVAVNATVAPLGRRVQLAVRPPGGAWRLEEVGASPSHLTQDPRIALAGRRLIVAWRELSLAEQSGRVLAAVREEGAWLAPQALPGAHDRFAPVPRIALDHRGNAIAVWPAPASGGAQTTPLLAAHLPPSGRWSAPTRIADVHPGGLYRRPPEVAVDRAGNAVAAWRGGTGGSPGVSFARRDAFSGLWGASVSVSGQGARPGGPALGVGDSGRVEIAWQRSTGNPRYALLAAGGSSLTGRVEEPDVVHTPSSSSTGSFTRYGVALGIDREGRATIVWQQPPRIGHRTTEVLAATGPVPRPGGITLGASQLLINQRISQAALRRSNAVVAALDAGLPASALREGGLQARAFGPSVTLAGAPSGEERPPGERYKVPVPEVVARTPGRVRVTAAQLRINQRIAQAAVRQSNALVERLAGGLTDRDLADGAITASKLAPGLSVAATAPPPPAGSGISVPRPGTREGQVELSAAQLAINQRISQAAVRRSNFAIALLESGLSEADFAPGSLTTRELAPELR